MSSLGVRRRRCRRAASMPRSGGLEGAAARRARGTDIDLGCGNDACVGGVEGVDWRGEGGAGCVGLA